MTLCQHGVQTGTGYECSSCVTQAKQIVVALDTATQVFDEVLKLMGPPPGWKPANAAALDDLAALRRWLFDIDAPGDPHITERLDRIEQYLRSEQR
jgi:hypothetical protein